MSKFNEKEVIAEGFKSMMRNHYLKTTYGFRDFIDELESWIALSKTTENMPFNEIVARLKDYTEKLERHRDYFSNLQSELRKARGEE